MNRGPGITHPLLDIEDIETDVKTIFSESSFENQKITDLVIDLIHNKSITTPHQFDKEMILLRRRYHINPKKSLLRDYYYYLVRTNQVSPNPTIEGLFKTKKGRSHSGVLIITVLTSPGEFSCPKDCHYCPNEVDKEGNSIMPRSYISTEPACRRATKNRFDAVLQFFDRARTLEKIGHIVDKVEILVLGGTWPFYPHTYQEEFIRDINYAANVYWDAQSSKPLRERLTLLEEQRINETARVRIIGITLETRPDYVTKTEIKRMRKFGCTRVQLGIQHTDDAVLRKVNRDATTKDSIKAIEMLRENCFKIDIHIMPDLPGSTPEMDRKMFDYILDSPDLQADYWKIYPCEVTPFTEIEKWYKNGTYVPYSEIDNGRLLIDLIKYVKRKVPEWIRLNRVIRDIPNQNSTTCLVGIIGGNQVTNLRQVIQREMKEDGHYCKCIRCREVKGQPFNWDTAKLDIKTYQANNGTEYFINIQTPNDDVGILHGFIRLRIPNPDFTKRLAVLDGCALIRELHVYGNLVKVSSKSHSGQSQHLGIGKRLLQSAESIARAKGYDRIAVISGVGVRDYYRKRGYVLEEEYGYMIKELPKIPTVSEQLMNSSTIWAPMVVTCCVVFAICCFIFNI